MDNMKKAFDASEFLNRLGIEDKLNEFLDSEEVKTKLLPKYEGVKANVTEALARLPEKNREAAEKLIADKFEGMTEEVFVEVVLGKFSEDIGYALYMLNKYLDVTAVTQQLLEAVAEKTALQNRLEEMAVELADALRRNLKASLFGLCSQDCESEDEVEEILHAIFDGDEDVPVVVTVEGAEDLAEAFAAFAADCIFGRRGDDEEDGCCCGAGEGECGCTDGACCCDDATCAECEGGKSEGCTCGGNCDCEDHEGCDCGCGNCSENSEESK